MVQGVVQHGPPTVNSCRSFIGTNGLVSIISGTDASINAAVIQGDTEKRELLSNKYK
jgi:hypothetical protein